MGHDPVCGRADVEDVLLGVIPLRVARRVAEVLQSAAAQCTASIDVPFDFGPCGTGIALDIG